MFNIEEIKELIFSLEEEFIQDNEFYEYNNKELSVDDLYMLDDYLSNFTNKLNSLLDDLKYEKENFGKYYKEESESEE